MLAFGRGSATRRQEHGRATVRRWIGFCHGHSFSEERKKEKKSRRRKRKNRKRKKKKRKKKKEKRKKKKRDKELIRMKDFDSRSDWGDGGERHGISMYPFNRLVGRLV